jgi:hypothetical protein
LTLPPTTTSRPSQQRNGTLHRSAKMAQAGILGNLKYDYTQRQWAVELGQALANFEHLSHPGQSLPYPNHDKAYIRSVITRHLTGHGLDHHRGQQCLVDLEVGGELFPDHLMAEVVGRVSRQYGDNCAFLRIGFAARLLELASISSDANLCEQYRQKARNSLHIIRFECKGVRS